MEPHRWQQLMTAWGWADNLATHQSLVKAYAESHRHYHNGSHILATLKHLEQTYHLADEPKEIALALWFHDAIYRPFSSHNEQDSAHWAQQFMQQNQAADAAISRVFDLIMATCHQAPTSTTDQALMVDIDLSILGAPRELYQQYEQWVRAEYRWVPGFIFKRKRKDLLTQFLEDQPIYQTEYFVDRFEQQAQSNLVWAISQL